ncbi:MAG: hypothetical protein ABFD50_22065, partial [Smithella sp.]
MEKKPVTSGKDGSYPKAPVTADRALLINKMIQILDRGRSLNQSLQQVTDTVSQSFKPVNSAFVRVSYDELVFKSKRFDETEVVVKRRFQLPGNQPGLVEIFLS